MVMKFSQTFDVPGHLDFPLDMLRYDQCWPASQNDVAALAVAVSRQLRTTLPGGSWKLKLMRYTMVKSDMPTVGRWCSFGVGVSTVLTCPL